MPALMPDFVFGTCCVHRTTAQFDSAARRPDVNQEPWSRRSATLQSHMQMISMRRKKLMGADFLARHRDPSPY
ncbi:hypothetical protein BG58_20885 [Caballeronia jiangsuensis]|nr:hypothetical protein BG58_20885 [Caballeronia jiangsuensis]